MAGPCSTSTTNLSLPKLPCIFKSLINGAVVDLSLISRHFTGHKLLCCSICGSFNHTVNLCPKTLPINEPLQKPQANLSTFYSDGQLKKLVRYTPGSHVPICNNFNESVCTLRFCKFMHVCSWCGDSHPRSVCPRRVRPLKSAK